MLIRVGRILTVNSCVLLHRCRQSPTVTGKAVTAEEATEEASMEWELPQ